jgi:Uma2 family endonuclease
MAVIKPRPMTIEEFQALPEGPPYYEFEEGEIVPMTSPRPEHQDIVDELVFVLKAYVRKKQAGRVLRELDVYLPDGRVLIPDIAVLTTERMSYLNPVDGKIRGVPDMVAEVTSGDAVRDRVHKFEVYLRNGVPWYWIVDQTTLAIEEYRATPEGYLRVSSVAPGQTFTPGLFPGLTIDLVALLGVTPEPQREDTVRPPESE